MYFHLLLDLSLFQITEGPDLEKVTFMIDITGSGFCTWVDLKVLKAE